MKDIRILIFIVIALAFLAFTQLGCVHTTIEKTAEGFTAKRTAVFYPFKTGVGFNPDTGLITFSYGTDGGEAMIDKAIETGVRAGVQAAKAGL